MNNTPGNAQWQGAEPRRASTLNAISNPKPHFHCKHSNFWFAHAKSKPKEPSLWFVVWKNHARIRQRVTHWFTLVWCGHGVSRPYHYIWGVLPHGMRQKRYSITCPCKLYFTPFLLITSWPFSIILTGLPASWSASIELIPVGSVKPWPKIPCK